MKVLIKQAKICFLCQLPQLKRSYLTLRGSILKAARCLGWVGLGWGWAVCCFFPQRGKKIGVLISEM